MDITLEETHPIVKYDTGHKGEYAGYAVGLGLTWFFCALVPFLIVEYWVKPNGWIPVTQIVPGNLTVITEGISAWTRYAWMSV